MLQFFDSRQHLPHKHKATPPRPYYRTIFHQEIDEQLKWHLPPRAFLCPRHAPTASRLELKIATSCTPKCSGRRCVLPACESGSPQIFYACKLTTTTSIEQFSACGCYVNRRREKLLKLQGCRFRRIIMLVHDRMQQHFAQASQDTQHMWYSLTMPFFPKVQAHTIYRQ